MAKILLLNFSVYGHTRKICEAMRAELAGRGEQVDIVPLTEFRGELNAYDAIVIGASIRHGKHNPAVFDFIRANRAALDTRPSGFFSVNLVARKPAKNTPQTNPYVKAFLAKTPWKPKLVGVFGGNLHYQHYGVIDRNAIRLIMWLTRGPTDPDTDTEFTNWDEVRRFAGRIADLAAGKLA